MDKRGKVKLFGAILLLLIAGVAGLYIFNLIPVAEAVTSDSTVSNATIAVSIGFTFSGNLSNGILFGSLNINTNDNNASANYLAGNGTGICPAGENASGCTAYQIQMDTNNNAGADTCIKDNAELTTGSDTIPNAGYTYDANSTVNGTNMNDAAGSTAMTTGFVQFGTADLAANDNQSSQFFLDIPDGQTAGDYNNTIDFKIVQTGASCV